MVKGSLSANLSLESGGMKFPKDKLREREFLKAMALNPIQA